MKFVLLVTAVASLPAFSQPAALPRAEAIFDRYIEVTGGAKAYAQRRTEVSTGIVHMAASGVSGTVEMYSQAPNSQVIVMDVQGIGKIEQGTNGTIAWEVSAVMGPRLKDGLEKTEALREAMFNHPLHWRKLFAKVETVGVEMAEGVECYKIVATPNVSGAKPKTYWFDKATGYAVKIRRTAVTAMGEIPAEIAMKNFRQSGGIVQPSTLVERASGQEIVIELQSVKANAPIPASRFSPPAEIRQMLPAAPAGKKSAPPTAKKR